MLLETELRKGRTTIGRRPHNDIVIDDLAISAEHAMIVLLDRDSFLEDLNSTNGTQVNGQPVRKHFLQNDDVIELAQFRITYLETQVSRAGHFPDSATKPGVASGDAGKLARIKVLSGAGAGRETIINKPITTIGKPNVQIAVIILQPQGYSIAHVEGEGCLLINDAPIRTEPHQLVHGDVIDLSGTRMQFLYN